MVMTRRILKEGIHIKHPSGVTSLTTLENLRNHRATIQDMADMLKEQLRLIDDDIKSIEALNKK
jgi:hypothetical protein